MNKLRAIWRIIIADKIAVFTWREAAPDPEWLTVPTFSWLFSNNWNVVDLDYVRRKVEEIIKHKNENDKTSSESEGVPTLRKWGVRP